MHSTPIVPRAVLRCTDGGQPISSALTFQTSKAKPGLTLRNGLHAGFIAVGQMKCLGLAISSRFIA